MSGITETFEIKAPEGALVFLSEQEYNGYKKNEKREMRAARIVGAPERYPCIGFEVLSVPSSPFIGECIPQKVMAFVYLHASEWVKYELQEKSQWQALDRFECALLTSE